MRVEAIESSVTSLSRRPLLAAVCLFVLLAVLLTACSRRQSGWETARAADTVESYETFLKDFPDGEFSMQAQARARELREARDWKTAVATNTLAAYQTFVAQYPDGRMADEARIRIESFTLAGGQAAMMPPEPPATVTIPPGGDPGASIPSSARSPAAEQTPSPMIKMPSPSGTVKAQAPASSETGGSGYRIQLGAFSGGEKQAMGEWRRLQGEFPQLLAGLSPSVKLATTTSGHLYRLQAGATTEPRARDICAKLQAEGRACVVVLP